MEKQLEHKQIHLLRHGDTGLSGRFIGSTDVPLTAVGLTEAQRAGLLLSPIEFQKVICSPMQRCKQTTEALSLSCAIEYNSLIQEINFGHWETKSFKEIAGDNQQLIDLWVSDHCRFAFPGGESITQFIDRISEMVEQIKRMPENKILLITHGGVIRHLLCLLLSLPLEKYMSFDIKTGKYCSLDLFSDGAVLTGLNL